MHNATAHKEIKMLVNKINSENFLNHTNKKITDNI